MTKDYKNVPRPSDKKTKASSKKPAAKAAPGVDKPSKKPTPGWVWMLGGLGTGLAIAGGIYVLDRDEEAVAKAGKAVTEAIKAVPVPELPDLPELPDFPEKKEAETDEQRFDFYTLLPELEVIIPDSEIKEEQAKLKPKEDIAYMIQVGSFRNYSDADSLKAQLAFLGIEAHILEGDEWHRVRTGPYRDKRELNRVRNRLHNNDINTMLVQLRD